jgi:hypothetical protein
LLLRLLGAHLSLFNSPFSVNPNDEEKKDPATEADMRKFHRLLRRQLELLRIQVRETEQGQLTLTPQQNYPEIPDNIQVYVFTADMRPGNAGKLLPRWLGPFSTVGLATTQTSSIAVRRESGQVKRYQRTRIKLALSTLPQSEELIKAKSKTRTTSLIYTLRQHGQQYLRAALPALDVDSGAVYSELRE